MHASFTTFALLALVAAVSGSIYPTYPIESSVLQAGRGAILRWKDEGGPPSLGEFGKTRIDLHVYNDRNLVSTLATDIDAADRAASVGIERYFGVDGGDYYLRFTSEQAHVAPVYSANFRIEGLTGNPGFRQGKGYDDNHPHHDGGDSYQAYDSNSTSITYGVSASTTDSYSYTGAYIYPSVAAATATSTYIFTGYSKSAGSSTRFQRPSEGSGLLSFVGLMYLFWPFVMGLAMAL